MLNSTLSKLLHLLSFTVFVLFFSTGCSDDDDDDFFFPRNALAIASGQTLISNRENSLSTSSRGPILESYQYSVYDNAGNQIYYAEFNGGTDSTINSGDDELSYALICEFNEDSLNPFASQFLATLDAADLDAGLLAPKISRTLHASSGQNHDCLLGNSKPNVGQLADLAINPHAPVRSILLDSFGNDNLINTQDDNILSWSEYSYGEFGNLLRYALYTGNGADNTWFTDDDIPDIYSLYRYEDSFITTIKTFHGPGVDDIWFTLDDRELESSSSEITRNDHGQVMAFQYDNNFHAAQYLNQRLSVYVENDTASSISLQRQYEYDSSARLIELQEYESATDSFLEPVNYQYDLFNRLTAGEACYRYNSQGQLNRLIYSRGGCQSNGTPLIENNITARTTISYGDSGGPDSDKIIRITEIQEADANNDSDVSSSGALKIIQHYGESVVVPFID